MEGRPTRVEAAFSAEEPVTTKPTIEVATLAGIDPREVPLPHGTQVTTTVEQPIPGSDRVVPQGVVGRVIGLVEGGRVRVQIVGRGELVYRRADLAPRKDGELRFAVRRAWAEQCLRPCAVLCATVGSRAWGLSDDASDTDTRGIFLLPFSWTVGLVEAPDVIVSADGSATYWEIEKTIRQALRADPNTLETLFVPDAQALDPIGERLLRERDAFVSREIYGSFGRYALAQTKRLRQSHRLAQHRSVVLEWLRGGDLDLDTVATRLADETIENPDRATHRAKQYLKQLYRSLYDQGLLRANSFDALVEFARQGAGELELPRELRPKNAYNLLRIVSCAAQWLETGVPLIVVEGELKDKLLAIKSGEVSLQTALDWTELAAQNLDRARDASPLPEAPDFDRADAMLRDARELAARRWVERVAGPWGADAPPAPRRLEQEPP